MPFGFRPASGPALGVLRPLCEELADGPSDIGTRKRGPKPGESRKAFARAAAGRREARRPTLLAGHLRRSGDGSARETDRRVRRFRTSACRRSAPLLRLTGYGGQARYRQPGYSGLARRSLAKAGRRSVGCLTIEYGCRAIVARRQCAALSSAGCQAKSPGPGPGLRVRSGAQRSDEEEVDRKFSGGDVPGKSVIGRRIGFAIFIGR